MATGTQALVLVVDDDPLVRQLACHALNGGGYRVVDTGEPDRVAALVRAEQPCLVLLDLMLPGTDGFELMEQIPELADLPVIFISGYNREETIARAFETGAVDYLVKPFTPTQLTTRVGAALQGVRAPRPRDAHSCGKD